MLPWLPSAAPSGAPAPARRPAFQTLHHPARPPRTPDMFKLLLRGALAAAVLLLVSDRAAAADPLETHVFEDATGKLPYRLLTPPEVEKGKRYPLVIFLHGAGER